MHYSQAESIDDLRTIAHARLPKIAWDFLDGGAEDNLTLDNNRAVLSLIHI